MTVDSLKECNKKVLVQMAKDNGIIGWHAMRKDQLIRALAPTLSRKRSSVVSKTDSRSSPPRSPKDRVKELPARASVKPTGRRTEVDLNGSARDSGWNTLRRPDRSTIRA